jgi:hypothetical protein
VGAQFRNRPRHELAEPRWRYAENERRARIAEVIDVTQSECLAFAGGHDAFKLPEPQPKLDGFDGAAFAGGLAVVLRQREPRDEAGAAASPQDDAPADAS